MARNTTKDIVEAEAEDIVVEDAPVEDATPEVAEPEPEVDVYAILSDHAARVEALRTAEDNVRMTREALASVIRSAREAAGMTRPPLARKAGMTIAQLAGIELGREATKDELRNLGIALNIEALASL